MTERAALAITNHASEIDLNRTNRPSHLERFFYWDTDFLVHTGVRTFAMNKGLSQLSPLLKKSLKKHLIMFTQQGNYAPSTYATIIGSLNSALRATPPSAFNTRWFIRALATPGFLNYKAGIAQFFSYWKERDSAAIEQEALRFLSDAASRGARPSNVLSDDPEKSYLTDEEYDGLLSATWDNYEMGASGTQITLIKLLSMQYARRPSQLAQLKIKDICIGSGTTTQGITGRLVNFPSAKDRTTETGFRDGRNEIHPLPDHLWELCQLQINEVKALYKYAFDFKLRDEHLKELPLFCSEGRINEAIDIIQNTFHLDLKANLASSHFHLRKLSITNILCWRQNTPSCQLGADKSHRSLRPRPPISPRTGKTMLITATRMRHTRARQLARRGVPKHVLSHWLGHTSDKSLKAYYSDPAEQARQLNDAMAPVLTPLAMAFTGALIDCENDATRATDPSSKLELASKGELLTVGRCGKHSFCSTASVPIPCYRCKHFEPLVNGPHEEVLNALTQRQGAEIEALKYGGQRNLLIPIDLSAEIRAVELCIYHCNARKIELKVANEQD
ncbi:site-specific integrase [Stutzerimonas stutzeri]|uniref:site-specific integrase n=1 Tax=Stutzerimonas stutzeri TaxID=316 RepID=UPI00030C7ACB|nr:site-specific integrase [Stutzerimonas stutzeri]QOZ96004.1 site-specific integrase [Stutzerimonas stutzeri]